MDLYAENILDHSRHPRKSGLLRGCPSHQERNLACGDEIRLSLKISDGKIEEVGWEGTGCAISQASMSILSEELIGKTEDEVLRMKKEKMEELLGVPVGPRRFKCALMSLHTAKNAIHTHRKEKLQSWVETVAVEE